MRGFAKDVMENEKVVEIYLLTILDFFLCMCFAAIADRSLTFFGFFQHYLKMSYPLLRGQIRDAAVEARGQLEPREETEGSHKSYITPILIGVHTKTRNK